MTLIKIGIKGLRCFEKKIEIELAVPNDESGSGLTIIVGPNSSGKSTIVEAFSLIKEMDRRMGRSNFTEEMRNKNDDAILIEATYGSGNKLSIFNDPNNVSKARVEKLFRERKSENLYVLPSRRAFRHSYDRKMSNTEKRSREIHMQSVSHIQRMQIHQDEFNSSMRKILEPPPNWKIDIDGNEQTYVKYIVDETAHNLDGVGDGLLNIFFINDAIYDLDEYKKIIVIDEPEQSLHPSLQKKIARLLIDCAANRQIILATHSPYFIDWRSIVNGAKIVRVVKEYNIGKVYQMSPRSVKKIEGLLSDLNNPHVLGLTANEVFFLDDKIILVEGQEDVIFYTKILEELGIEKKGEFYGWGVGGANKMTTIASILYELGFKNVVGILDKGKESEMKNLASKFPDYRFFVIPANDVRTKKERGAEGEVIGLVDESGKMRMEYIKEVKELFSQINSKF